MRESLIPVTKWLDSPTDHEAMSIAAQKGFQINGLLALVEDGPARTLAIYTDERGVHYKEKRADGIMRGGRGIPDLSLVVTDRIKELLPKDDRVVELFPTEDRNESDPTISDDGQIHVLPTPSFPVYGDLGREGTRRVPTGDGRDGSLRVGPGGI